MLLKTILGNFFDVNPHLALVLDLVLALVIMNTRETKLILLYFTVLIINIIIELLFRQMSVLSEYELTAQNIEKLADLEFELRSNVRLAI